MTIENAPAAPASPASAPQKKGHPWLFGCLGCLGLLIIFIIIVVVVALKVTSPVVTTVNSHLTAIKAGDLQKAYDYCSEDFKKATPFEQFTAFVNYYPALSKNKSIKIDSREIKNNMGLVKGSLVGEDGSTAPIEYKLVKENNQWKILRFDLKSGGIQIENTPQTPVSPQTEGSQVIKVVMGKARHPKTGDIVEETTVFDSKDKFFYADVHIKDAKSGQTFGSTWIYEKGQGKVGPFNVTIKKAGHNTLNFSLNRKSPTWPKGNYELIITSNDKEIFTQNFSVK